MLLLQKSSPSGWTFRQTQILLSLLPLIASLIVLFGWSVNSHILRRIIDSPTPMNPATAVAFILLGGCLLAGRHRKAVTCGIALLVVLGVILKLADIFYGTSFQIDSFLFRDKLIQEPRYPNQMAPNTALSFLLISVALAVLRGLSGRWVSISQLLSIMVAVISLFAITGHLFHIKELYDVKLFTPMALITAILFFITAWAVILDRPNKGMLRFIFHAGPSGNMAQFLLPAAIAVPLLWACLRLFCERRGYFHSEFGIALSVPFTAIVFFTLSCICSYFLYLTDAKRIQAESKLDFLASHDSLTGLNNSRVFFEKLSHRLELEQRRLNDRYSLFYLDVDGLKQVNDQLGHQTGNKLLIQVADILKNVARSSDTVARIGGDEFVILFEQLPSGMETEISIATRILEQMPGVFHSERGQVKVGISIGIVTSPSTEIDPDHIVAAADDALYEAKRRGKNCYVISAKSSSPA